MTEKQRQDAYAVFVEKYLGSNPDAVLFVLGYTLYCHSIDDLCDNEIPVDLCRNQLLLKVIRMAPVVFNNNFYLTHINKLYPLVMLAHDTYVESLNYEHSNIQWQKALSDYLRQNANEVILACVEIVGGYAQKVGAAAVMRELAYINHHDANGVPC